MASANNFFKTHEEYRRNKELEDARKAGIAPAAVDEEGKEINPHIPQYMSSAPWYLNSDRPSLKHQKDWRQRESGEEKYYDRGAKVFQAHKFRKGACENCGSMSHKTKHCLERPRAKGAKWTNKNIAADEKVEDINLVGFDAKRDRWNGYDASSYSRVVDLYEKVDETKRQMKKDQELEKRFQKKGEEGAEEAVSSDSEDEEDEDKITEMQEAGFSKLEKRVRTTGGGASGSVRNLRIREDTAKYLLNLDPNSAHYDPKSRSMREDPNPSKDPSQKTFAGDNFVRKSGDYHGWDALNLYSHHANEKGQELLMQAIPSQAEALYKQFKAKKEKLAVKSKASVMETYGNAAEAPPDEALLLGQTERYVEYDATGRVIKGEESKAHSRYEEDVLNNNHTAVWGSWWNSGTWGYACCKQTVKNSYCTGSSGQAAAADSVRQIQDNMAREAEAKVAEQANNSRDANANGALAHKDKVWGTEVDPEIELDDEKLAAAIKKQEEFNKSSLEDERKRGYNSMADTSVTPEEMEAYRLKKARADDPMNLFKPSGTAGYEIV